MIRTTTRGTHRAEGPAVIDYRALLAPVSKGATGVAAATAIAATGAAGLSLQSADAAQPSAPKNIHVPTAARSVAPAAPSTATLVDALGRVTLGTGSRGSSVEALQTLLNQNGAKISVDGKFGPATRSAVMSFQSSKGLAVDGRVGPATRGAFGKGSSARAAAPAKQASSSSSASAMPKLRYGARGEAVRTLQQKLRAAGADIKVDGVFGSNTKTAVFAAQRANNLGVDGVVGPNTWSALLGGSKRITKQDRVAAETKATVTAPASNRSSFDGNSIVAMAESQMGKEYVWGSSNPNVGFDCSGLVKYVYNSHGITVPRTAKKQAFAGRFISKSEAQPGDLVVFTQNNYGHIAIYAGGDTIVDASASRDKVVKRSIWSDDVLFVTYR